MKTKSLSLLLPVFLGAAVILSCSKIKPDPKVPCYLHIDSVGLTTNYLVEGSSSHRISCAWISVDGTNIGTFELPCTIPVIADEGEHDVKVEAGISLNGISATRNKFHYFTPFEAKVNLVKEQTVSISPAVVYESYTNFPWKEDFEGNSFSLEKSGNCDAGISIAKSAAGSAFEGSGSAYFAINSSQTNFEFQSAGEYGMPKDDRDIFLELNFKTNLEITIGLYTKTLTASYREPIMTLNPTNGEWKKIYVYLTTISQKHADAGGHRIFFASTNNGSDSEIFLDNIKLVY